ncbi:MAG: Kelch repeat-containing protein [Planctomycetota bacterium]|jgi:hypothetical protein
MVRALALCVCVILVNAAMAGENQRKGPLAGLPSAPGAHVARINAMGDRSWLDLGAPKPDPKWGRAPGRSYNNKMGYAPDLVGAFLQGEGVHGGRGTGPRAGYYNDDVFFYDLMAHGYICIYPGTKEDRVKFRVDEKGFCSAPDGQNLPVALAGHSYECLSYNVHTGEFMTLLIGSPYAREIQAILPIKGKDGVRGRKNGRHPYFYSTLSGRWERRKIEGPGPSGGPGTTLRYIPDRKLTVFFNRRAKELWSYDHGTNKWDKVKPQGVMPQARQEGTTAYDSKRGRLYIFNDIQEHIPGVYDFRTNTFSTLKAANQPYPPSGAREEGARILASTSSSAHYASVAGTVGMRLRIRKKGGGRGPSTNLGLAIYDPEKNAWEKEIVPLPGAAQRKGAWNSCYSPELNVHVFHLAGDSQPNGTVVLYRHKRRAHGQRRSAGPAASSGE